MTDEIVLIGCGSIGSRHGLNAELLGYPPVAVADPHIEGIPLEMEHKYQDPEECLNDWAKDRMVIIASPTKLHVPQAKLALELGAKSVLIEKPIGISMAEVESLGPWADKIKVAHNYRFLPVILTDFGPIARKADNAILFIAAADQVHEWPSAKMSRYMFDKEGGGCLLTSGIHALDLAAFIMGDVITCSGKLMSTDDYEVDTGISIGLIHQTDGRRSIISNMWTRENRYSVICLTLPETGETLFYDVINNGSKDFYDMYLVMLERFIKWNSSGPSWPLCDFGQALHIMRVVDQIRSLQEAK